MMKNVTAAFMGLPIGTRLVIALAAFLVIATAIGSTITGISEFVSHYKTKQALTAAQEKIKTAEAERDAARQDAATARGVANELQSQLATVDSSAAQSETRLTAARKSTTEAKKKYETTTKITTTNDTRTRDAKRAELRARYAERGIIVTEK